MTGAMLVVGVPAALSRVRPAERPGTGARVFSGIGEGIATSGTLVPWLVGTDVALTWLAMAGVASVLAAWAWWAVWRHLAPLTAHTAETGRDTRMLVLAPSLVIIAYGLDAAGFVPHTLFWMDYIAR